MKRKQNEDRKLPATEKDDKDKVFPAQAQLLRGIMDGGRYSTYGLLTVDVSRSRARTLGHMRGLSNAAWSQPVVPPSA